MLKNKKIITLIVILFSFTPLFSENGIKYVYQTWNNCGPASLSMLLSYWGEIIPQKEIETIVKTHHKDLKVSITELQVAASSYGYKSISFNNRNIQEIKDILNRGMPVITPVWLTKEDNSQMGHYLLILNYNNDGFLIKDSLNYDNTFISYFDFDTIWNKYGSQILLIFPSSIQPPNLLKNTTPPIFNNNFFDLYNIGRFYLNNGNITKSYSYFKKSLKMDYNFKYLLYNHELLKSFYLNGNYKEIIHLTTLILIKCENVEEIWYWRGKAFLKLGNIKEAKVCFKKALLFRNDYKEVLKELL